MTRRIKTFEDEDLRARRVYTRLKTNSKSSYAYKKRTAKNSIKFDTPYSKEVVIKITGASNNYQQWKKHFDYNIKKFDHSLYEDENTFYQGDEEIKYFEKYFNDYGDRLSNKEDVEGKGKREVLQLAFSMKHHESTPSDKLMQAVIKTVKEKYPNNASYFVYHSDTDNPHIHCDLKISGMDGKRLDIRKNDLAKLRKEFAKNLNSLGVEAYATSKWERSKNRTIYKDKDEYKKEKENIKKHHHKVIEFGQAKYKFDEKNRDSYFVSYQTTKGEVITIWGKELEKVIKENDIKVGEFVKFKKIDKEPVQTTIRKKRNGKREVFTKTSYKDIWDCSILGRNEKDLKINPKTKDKQINYKFETVGFSELEKKNAEFIKMRRNKRAKENRIVPLKKRDKER